MTSKDSQQATIEIGLTEFRNDLSDVIRDLPETGPVRIVAHNHVVAEIRPAGPERDAAYLQRWKGLFDRLSALELTGAINCGMDTYEALTAFVDLYEEYTESGVALPYPDCAIPSEGRYTAEEVIARIYFQDSQDLLPDEVAWFHALVEIQRYASGKGMRTELPDAWETGNAAFVTEAKEHGQIPETLVAFCRQATDQGVELANVLDLMGKEPIPADVLTMRKYRDYQFQEFIENGLPHAETVTLYRRDTDLWKAGLLVGAGIKTAAEIATLIDLGVDCDLAARAAGDGMTPDEWRPVMPAIQKYKYEAEGLLNFRLLATAAQRGISLVRWDKNSLMVARDQYPWDRVYPDRVLELAEAKVAPTFFNSYAEFASPSAVKDDLVGEFLSLLGKGMTAAHIKAMRRNSRKLCFKPSPEQIGVLLDEGLTPHQAQYLGERSEEFDVWLAVLKDWKKSHAYVTQFIEAKTDHPAWDDLRAVGEHYRATRKNKYLRYELQVLTQEAIELLGTPEKLLEVHLEHLFHAAKWILNHDENHSFRKMSAELLEGRTKDAVESLQKDFKAMLGNLYAPAVQEGAEHNVERADETLPALPSAQRQIGS